MKKLIAVVGESSENLLTLLKSVTGVQPLSIMAPFTDHLPDSLRIDSAQYQDNQPFRSPLLLCEHHVRHFFSKIHGGIVSVSGYAGKVLKTPAEVTDYFLVIVSKAYGKDFLSKRLVETFEDKPDGVYVVTDLTAEQVAELKTKLPKQFVTLGLKTEDEVQKTDLVLPDLKSNAASRKTLNQLIKKITGELNV